MQIINDTIECQKCGYGQADSGLDRGSQTHIIAGSRCADDEPTGDGIIYVLTNPFSPGFVMIGCTIGLLEDYMAELYSEAVLCPFLCHFAARVKNAFELTRQMYELFSDKRVDPSKDFFRIPPEKAVLEITMGPYTEVTPGKSKLSAEDKAFAAKEERKRSAIKLREIGIQLGAVLTFSRNEDIQATVVPGNRVEYQGQAMTLSAAALSALHRLGYGASKASGCDYWLYEGKTLDEIRNEQKAAKAL